MPLNNYQLIEASVYNTLATRFCNEKICGVGLGTAGQLADGITESHKVYNWSCNQNSLQRKAKQNVDEELAKHIRNELDLDFLGNAYPNPAKKHCQIPYKVLNSNHSKIVIYDMLKGMNIQTHDLSVEQSLSGSIKIDLEQLVNGIYLYSLVIEGKIVNSKKLLIIK